MTPGPAMKNASRIKTAATVASVVRASLRPGAPGIAQRVQAVPRLVRGTVEGTYAGTTLRRLGLVAAAVAYVASPVDLLPEAALPVLGAADDAVVITWAVKTFFEETDRFIAWELGQGAHLRGQASPSQSQSPSPSPGRGESGRLTEGVRQAATDRVLESVRKRLER